MQARVKTVSIRAETVGVMFHYTRVTWQVGMMRRPSTLRPGNMASASVLCRFGHSCTEYSMPQTVVVTGMSMSLRNEYTDSAKGVLLAQVRQRDLVFLAG